MKRPQISVILLVLLATCASVVMTLSPWGAVARGAEEELPPSADFVPGQLIIRFKAGVTPEQITDFYAEYGLAEKADLDNATSASAGGLKLAAAGMTVNANLVTLMESDPRVEYAEPNYLLHMFKTPDDADFDRLWGLSNTGQTGGTAGADISAVDAWNISTGSATVIVGVIDTGVDYNHEDLAPNMWVNPGECPQNKCTPNNKDDDNNGYIDDFHGVNTITDSGDPMDDFGHGTHVAGTIGAAGNNKLGVVGVNWTVRIAACKFLSASGSGSVASAIKCFNYFHDLKTKQKQNILLTNNSWGGASFSQALRDAMAGPDQPLHICAAGNANTDVPHFPASYDLANIISVAATDHNDQYASFSNHGADWVDLAAPGVDILSTVPKGSCALCGPSGYETASGTSMATPHVAGAVALVWAQYPKLTNDQMKQRILSGIDPLRDHSKQTLTNGRLNLFNALEDDTTPPAAVTDLAVAGVLLTKVNLTWIATGDDERSGKANRYDVRYSLAPISDANWEQATPAEGAPAPQPPGARETFTVTGLEPGQTYYFAVKVVDNIGNAAELSNVVIGKTSPGTIVFEDNMESGPAKWTTAGKDNLWHLSTLRANSPSTAWYYGKEDTRTYETGGANNGTITSLPIDLVGADDVLLTFYEWSALQTSARLDRTRVQVSTDGELWATVFESHGTEDAWVKHSISLSAYITPTGSIQVRFWFDTIDGSANNFEGWYVDDVQVLTAKLATPGEQRPGANLVMQENNILFNPANPSTGQAITVHTVILNNGSADANNVLVQFMDTSGATPTPIGQQQVIPTIAVGGSSTAQVVYATTDKVGEYTIQAVVDPNNFIAELNEADNVAARKLTIGAAAAANLVVKIANIGFEPPNPNPGDQVTIRATVLNTGTLEARAVVVQFADVTGLDSTPITPGENPALLIDLIPPGGSSVAQITFDTAGVQPGALGGRDIEVTVDPNNAIPEVSESDNKAEKTLKLAPLFAPNLNVQATNIGFSPATPTASDSVTIYATILNDGNAPANGVAVQFMDLSDFKSTPIGQQQTIETIPIGGSGVVQITYDTTGKPGDRKIEVAVDPNNFIPESKETDNKSQKTLKVTGPAAPNLVAQANNVNFSPGPKGAPPIEGELVTIYATILNNGTTDAQGVVVQFVDATGGGARPIGDKQTIDSISAGSSGVAQATYDTALLAALRQDGASSVSDRQIQVVVDPSNFIIETSETDNIARETLRLTPAPAPNLVMLAGNIQFNPPDPTENEAVTIHAVVLNNGITAATNVLVQFIDLTTGNAVPIVPEQFIPLIPAGGSGAIEATFARPTGNSGGLLKDRKIQVIVDSNNLIAETNEGDNAATRQLAFAAAPAPNLVMLASNIGFNPPTPTAGDRVTITALILNTGSAVAENVTVQFINVSSGRPLPIGLEQIIAMIPIGGSGMAQIAYATDAKVGDHKIQVAVDPNNLIAETNETDNKNSVTLAVAAPPTANLLVQPNNIGFSPATPVEGNPVTVTVTIFNNGVVTAENVLVQFVDVTGGGFAPIGAKQTITTIVAGGSATTQVVYDTTNKAGERKIYVVADPHASIPETSEADNIATQTLIVAAAAAPNLVVQEANIGAAPANPGAGTLMTVTATILNSGNAEARDVSVQFADVTSSGGAIPIAASQTIELIPAGGSATVFVLYDTRDKTGDRKLQVTVDSNNLIPESNETDNTARKTLKVAAPAAPNLAIQAGNIGFDPPTPQQGDQVTIYATVINDGNADASDVIVQFVDMTNTSSAIPIGQPQTIAAIPAGGSSIAQITYDTTGMTGDRKIQVVVDPNNFIPESKETDNTIQKTLTMVTGLAPNLVAQATNIGVGATTDDAVTLIATIINDGNAVANDVIVQFMDATDTTALPIGQPQIIADIPIGGSGVAQVTYTGVGQNGDGLEARKIQVVVDPNNFIVETKETDNTATRTLAITPFARPNLQMQASNIGFNPPQAIDGDEVMINAAVLNNGPADAHDVTVQFVDVTDGSTTPIGAPQTIGMIAAGSSATAQLAYASAGKTGERKVQVVVDPNNFIPEMDEGDNKAVASLSVAPPPTPNLKVLPGNLKFEPAEPQQGNLVTITVTILNDGTAVANDVVVQLTDLTSGSPLPIGTEQLIDTIAAGSSTTLHVLYDDTEAAGERTIEVVVDPTNIIAESDENDNRATKPMLVLAPIIPNLVIQPSNLVFTPTQPIEGDPVTVTVMVLNQGTGDTTNVVVLFTDVTDGGADPIGEPQTIQAIAAGGSGTAQVIFDSTEKVGERRIQVTVDPENVIAETDEEDNTAAKTLRIISEAEKPPPQANLVLRTANIQFSPITPTVGSPVTVTVIITNSGDAAATDLAVQFMDATDGGSEIIGRTQITGTLAAGRSGKTQVIYDTTNKAGKREIQVTADPDNAIPEADETDNQASKTITVTASSTTSPTVSAPASSSVAASDQPNLVVLADNINVFAPDYISEPAASGPLSIDEGAVTIEVPIFNTGTRDANNVVVQFVAMTNEGWDLVGSEQTIASIPSGDSVITQVTYDMTGQTGYAEIRVLVDPANLIAEAIETDNKAGKRLSLPAISSAVQSP